ncbi:hypothetical protein KC19_N008500 [Ceratodon purpureus]|nr:hypothetical protein KC19_N008500 [Ceratodon purpureus]
MSQYKVDMATVNQKLDLLINAVMPTGVGQRWGGAQQNFPLGDVGTHPVDNNEDVAVNPGVVNVTSIPGASDPSGTASGMTDELSTRTRLFTEPVEGPAESEDRRTRNSDPRASSFDPLTSSHPTNSSHHTVSNPTNAPPVQKLGPDAGLQAAFGLTSAETELLTRKRLPERVLDATQLPDEEDNPKPAKRGRVPRNKATVFPAALPAEEPSPSVQGSVTVQRPKRVRKRPSKFIDHVPPSENKPRAEMSDPLTPKKAVWVLHPEHPNKTIALGRCGPHWRSYKKRTSPT